MLARLLSSALAFLAPFLELGSGSGVECGDGNLIKSFQASLYFCGEYFHKSLMKLDIS